MFHSRIRSFLHLLLLFWLSVGPAAGQTMRFVDTRNGLSSMFVLSLYQDVRGFVWAGTYSGLSILDGNGTSVAFADRPEVWAEAGVMVRSIDGAADGTVWMTTNFGLDCWDMTSGRREHHTEFTGAYRVAVGPRGDVVVLTPDKGYFAYNALQHRFQKLTAELVADRDVHAMSIDSAGLWRVITRTHTLEATLVTEADGRVVTLQPRKVPHAMGRLVTAKADADRLLMVDEQGVFYEGDYPLTTTTTIKANTAYLPENRQLIIDLATLDSPMTGVQAAEMVNGKLSNGKCYDLSGREMVNARSAKEDASRLKKLPQGIYVTKKKKFVVKP